MDILVRESDIVVVNKPPGLLAQPDHTGDPNVVSLLQERLTDGDASDPFVGLVHRLDRPASGVMVVGRNSEAARVLSRQVRERTVEKQYLVVVQGELQGIGTWIDYVAKTSRQPRLVSSEHPEGKRAELSWQALARAHDRTLLQVTLDTGRSHQIRLQASERGHPVVGDRRYGASSSLGGGAIALHHVLMRVDVPGDRQRRTFTSRPPALWNDVLTGSMQDAIEQLIARASPPSSPSE